MTGPRQLAWNWKPKAGHRVIRTIEMHTCGEPLRVIIDGLPKIEGQDVLARRAYFRSHFDSLRTALMFEPRGHADMYGAVISAGVNGADFEVFFLHNEGFSTMCGHAIIALTKLVIEAGLIAGPAVTFDVPAGRIHARAELDGDIVCRSIFRNVPSFVLHRDQQVAVPGLGPVRFDVAYGGAFYAIVDAQSLDVELSTKDYVRLIDYGRSIKQAVAAGFSIEHPFEPELSFLYGTIFTGPAEKQGHHSRNVCVFAEGEVDRSPTGSGVSARAALHCARGDLALGCPITIESILGTCMTVTALENAKYGSIDAVIPEVSGSAFVTGANKFVFDPADPVRDGFILR
jgi:proline racemase